MINFSKNFVFNPAEIRIFNIKCNFNNIAKISTALDFKNLFVTIDSVTAECSLLTLIKDQRLRYFEKLRSNDCVEISAIVPCSLFDAFLNQAIKENPENIFIFNLIDSTSSGMCLLSPFQKLVAKGIADVFVSISLDENAMLICMNKSLISPRSFFKKLKALCFD